MFRVKSDKSDWLWSQSIVFAKPFKHGMSLDWASGRDSWCWPKGARPLGTRMTNVGSCFCYFFFSLSLSLPPQILSILGFHVTSGKTKIQNVKVAEHSFRARFRRCNPARAQRFQKTNMPSIERSFYLLNTGTHCVIFLYNWTQRIDGFSLLLQRYVRKSNDAKNPAIFDFSLLPKEPSLMQRMRSCSKNWDRLLFFFFFFLFFFFTTKYK